jgi:PAS domain S-box-containing protein
VRKSETRYRRVIDEAMEIIFSVTLQGTILSLNPAFQECTGWRRDEWIGRSFFECLDPASAPAAEHDFAKLAADEEPFFVEYSLLTAGGAPLTVEVSAGLIDDEDQRVILGVARDVTLRRKIESELEQERRLASLGRLAASVAHEFNNVLMSILPFAELLKRRVPNDDRVELATRHIFQAIRRGRQVSQDILRLARPAVPNVAPVFVDDWLEHFGREAAVILGPLFRITSPTARCWTRWRPTSS